MYHKHIDARVLENILFIFVSKRKTYISSASERCWQFILVWLFVYAFIFVSPPRGSSVLWWIRASWWFRHEGGVSARARAGVHMPRPPRRQLGAIPPVERLCALHTLRTTHPHCASSAGSAHCEALEHSIRLHFFVTMDYPAMN